jgi:hypothetical protein
MPLELKTSENINIIETIGDDDFGQPQGKELQIIGTTGNVLMSINASGNIGIGTTEPESKLHVNGNVQISGTATMPSLYVGSLFVDGQEVTGGGGGGGGGTYYIIDYGVSYPSLQNVGNYNSNSYLNFTGNALPLNGGIGNNITIGDYVDEYSTTISNVVFTYTGDTLSSPEGVHVIVYMEFIAFTESWNLISWPDVLSPSLESIRYVQSSTVAPRSSGDVDPGIVYLVLSNYYETLNTNTSFLIGTNGISSQAPQTLKIIII